MRIRKNAKKVEGGGSVAMVCQLNQSPWDLSPFGPHLFHQFEYGGGDDSFPTANAHGISPNSVGPLHSVASPSDAQLKPSPNIDNNVAAIIAHDKGDNHHQVAHKVKVDVVEPSHYGKCKDNNNKEAKKKQVEEEGDDDDTLLISSMMRSKGAPRRARGQNRNKKKAPLSSNPNEFYYYSGFGPLWGKQRGGNHHSNNNSNINAVNPKGGGTSQQDYDYSTITSTTDEPNGSKQDYSLHIIDAAGGSFDDEEQVVVQEDYDHEGGGGKKRMRKPVKARSLKSLM